MLLYVEDTLFYHNIYNYNTYVHTWSTYIRRTNNKGFLYIFIHKM